VAPRIPVLLKGGAKALPAFFLWTDSYLATTHGDERIDFEYGKKEVRNGGGSGETFADFIRLYAEKDVSVVATPSLEAVLVRGTMKEHAVCSSQHTALLPANLSGG
jgi:hypothetical protein